MSGYAELKKQQAKSIKREIQYGQDEFDLYEGHQVDEAFSLDEATYDELFIESSERTQKKFYKAYAEREKDNREYRGQRIYESKYKNPEEVEVHGKNLWLHNRISRRRHAKSSLRTWQEKINNGILGVGNEPKHGLHLEGSPGSYTIDLMKSTHRLTQIESKKNAIRNAVLRDVDQNAEETKKFNENAELIYALAPTIKIIETEDFTDNPQYDEASVQAYREFIKKAIKDPIGVIKNAVSDAVYSYGDISLNVLDSKGLPQKFDEIKQLRDRYKAIALLAKSKELSPELKKVVDDLKTEQAESKNENLDFARHMYKCLDSDMRFALKKYGIGYDDDGSLVDSVEERGRSATYPTDGNLTFKVLSQIKKKQNDKKKYDTEIHWDRSVSQFLKENADDTKDKKSAKNDKYKLNEALKNIGTAENIFPEERDKETRGLFKQLKENAASLSKAIYDIDTEVAASERILREKPGELKSRPSMERRINNYIEARKQLQLDLMDRIAGYINVLNHLATEDIILTPLGRAILEKTKRSISKKAAQKEQEEAQEQKENEDDIEFEGFGIELKALPDAQEKIDDFRTRADRIHTGIRDMYTAFGALEFSKISPGKTAELIKEAEVLVRQYSGLRILGEEKISEEGNTIEDEMIGKMEALEAAAYKRDRKIDSLKLTLIRDNLELYKRILKDGTEENSPNKANELKKRIFRKNRYIHQNELEQFLKEEKDKMKKEEEEKKKKKDKKEDEKKEDEEKKEDDKKEDDNNDDEEENV